MEKWIGVVGGVGPFAGIDLLGKIAAQTRAHSDQGHLTVLNWSQPEAIADRTEFLLGKVRQNPALALAHQLQKLEQMGATVAGIPCNTAHAPRIFSRILAELAAAGSKILLLNMIDEVGRFLQANLPAVRRVGLLATTGTVQSGLYQSVLAPLGLTAVIPSPGLQTEKIHPAIYDPQYGLKACGRATSQSLNDLHQGTGELKQGGAEVIILGCTELPLAFTEPVAGGLPLIDPTLILARALIREAAPGKLKPYGELLSL